jgi:hypothetical protein
MFQSYLAIIKQVFTFRKRHSALVPKSKCLNAIAFTSFTLPRHFAVAASVFLCCFIYPHEQWRYVAIAVSFITQALCSHQSSVCHFREELPDVGLVYPKHAAADSEFHVIKDGSECVIQQCNRVLKYNITHNTDIIISKCTTRNTETYITNTK